MSQVVLSHDEAVVQLAEDFVARYRRGEAPHLKDYVERFPEMAGEIESLVDALLFMEKLGSKQSDGNKTAGDEPPEQLGEYRILGELGRGGMGVVYEAMQPSLSRKVAIKVLPRLSTHQSVMKDRFLREARTAASLHHSHIVPVHGVGEQNGACYFVMQLIDGISCDRILQHIRLRREHPATTVEAQQHQSTHHTNKTTGQTSQAHTKLSRQLQEWQNFSNNQRCRKVAEIGAAMAEALDYAHQQQVVHRDIKPGNILIDEHQHPWLNDFGLARPIEGSDITTTGQVVGTLRYLPPERFEGQSTPAGDIYALGMTLYELIALHHPFPGSDQARVIKQIHDELPAPLTTTIPEIPVDLNTVIMKCLAKHQADRYQRAASLAADLRAVLNDEPISARPLRWWEKTGRWMRRNPLIASLLCLVFASLTAGLTVSTLLWKHAEEQREAALKATSNATVARNESDALNTFFREEILDAARPGAKGKDVTLAQALEKAEGSISRRFKDVPQVELVVRMWLGETYRTLGKYKQAEKQAEQIVQMHREMGTTESAAYVSAYGNLANALSEQGKNKEAEKIYRELLLLLKVLPNYELVKQESVLQNFASVLQRLNQGSEAERVFKEVYDQRMERLGPDDKETLLSQVNLAYHYMLQSKFAQAEKMCKDAVARFNKIQDPNDPICLTARQHLVKVAFFRKDYPQAEKQARELLPILEAHLGEDHAHTLQLMNNLGAILAAQNRADAALEYQQRAARLLEEKTGIENNDTLIAWANLGINLYKVKRYDDAIPVLDRVIRKRKDLDVPHDQYTSNAMFVYAHALLETQQYQKAGEIAEQYLSIASKQPATSNADARSNMQRVMAAVSLSRKQFEQAEKLLNDCWAWQKQSKVINQEGKLKTVKLYQQLYTAWQQPEKLKAWEAQKASLEAGK